MNFSEPGIDAIEPGRFFLANSVGLAVTEQPMAVPAGVLVFGLESGDTDVGHIQILSSANTLAALHGSLKAWSRRLPTAERDQYDALASEASAKWKQRMDAFFGAVAGAVTPNESCGYTLPHPAHDWTKLADDERSADQAAHCEGVADDVPPNAGSAS